MFIFLGYGVGDLQNAWKLKKDSTESELVNLGKPHIMRLTKRELKSLELKHVWRGKGTEQDPFTLTDRGKLTENLTINIKKTKSHVKIDNFKLDGLKMEWCQNIIVSNCEITKVQLDYCHGLKFINNKVDFLRFSAVGGNFFEANELHEKVLNELNKKGYVNALNSIVILTFIIVVWSVLFMFFNALMVQQEYTIIAFLLTNGIIIVSLIFVLNKENFFRKVGFYRIARKKPNIIR